MKTIFNNSEFFEANGKTLYQVMKAKSRRVSDFGDLQLIEIRRWNGLKSEFNKYVWIFHNGKNVTPLIALHLGNKVSKSKKFCGALKNHGHGFWYADYVADRLRRTRYKNFEDLVLRLVTIGLVKIQK